jgi:hypothetical protein
MTALLDPKPHISPGYKSGEIILAEGWENDDKVHVQGVRASISEHPGGRLSLILSKDDREGSFTVITLDSDATAALRQALNRAHRERTR